MDTLKEDIHAQEIDSSVDAITAAIAPKADIVKRALAALVDVVVAGILGSLPVVGSVAGLGYILLRDGLDFKPVKHQSVGKKLLKLKLVRMDGESMDIVASVRRNFMFALGTLSALVAWIPVLGLLAVLGAALFSFLIAVYEVYLVFTDPEGRRWGDTFAGTKVIEIDE